MEYNKNEIEELIIKGVKSNLAVNKFATCNFEKAWFYTCINLPYIPNIEYFVKIYKSMKFREII